MEACVPVTDLLLYVLYRVDLQIYGIPHDSLLIVNALLIFRALEWCKIIASFTVEPIEWDSLPSSLGWAEECARAAIDKASYTDKV